MENQKKSGKEIIISCIIILAIYGISIVIPSFAMLGVLLMAALVCFNGVRHSVLASEISSLLLLGVNFGVSFLFHGGFESAFSPVVFMVAFGGIASSICIRKQLSLARTTIITTVAIVIGIVFPIFLLDQFFIPHYITGLKNELSAYVYEVVDTLAKNMDLNGSVEQFKSQYLTILQLISPGMVIILSAAYSFLFPWIARLICRRRGDMSFEYMPCLTRMRSDKITPIVFILSFVLMLILQNQMMMVFVNLALITGTVMLVFGFSLIAFYVKNFIRRWPMRILVCLLLLFIPSVGFLLILLGIIDAFKNFRHLQIRGGKNE